jgi:hypothetical protein
MPTGPPPKINKAALTINNPILKIDPAARQLLVVLQAATAPNTLS